MQRPFEAKKGQVIFQPGQECAGYLILAQGAIKVTLTGASGREVVLYRVRPGEVCLQTFSCLVDGTTYAAEGMAETDLKGEIIPAAQFAGRMGRGWLRQRIMRWLLKPRAGEPMSAVVWRILQRVGL